MGKKRKNIAAGPGCAPGGQRIQVVVKKLGNPSSTLLPPISSRVLIIPRH